MYKSFAPIKQTTFTTVMAVVELTSLITGQHSAKIRNLDLAQWHTNRGCVVETMLDLLDLYAHFHKSTKVGSRFPLDKFIEVKIALNKEVETNKRLHRYETWCDRCEAEVRDIHPITPGSATSPATNTSFPPTAASSTNSNTAKRSVRSTDATMRFVFDEDEARRELDAVQDFFREDFEEYEVEVEEKIPESEIPKAPRENRGPPRHPGDHGGHGHGHGWAPYHRGGRHGHGHGGHDGRQRGRRYG